MKYVNKCFKTIKAMHLIAVLVLVKHIHSWWWSVKKNV